MRRWKEASSRRPMEAAVDSNARTASSMRLAAARRLRRVRSAGRRKARSRRVGSWWERREVASGAGEDVDGAGEGGGGRGQVGAGRGRGPVEEVERAAPIVGVEGERLEHRRGVERGGRRGGGGGGGRL